MQVLLQGLPTLKTRFQLALVAQWTATAGIIMRTNMVIREDLLICPATKVSWAKSAVKCYMTSVERFVNLWCVFSAMPSQPGAYQGQPGYNQYPPEQYGQPYNSYPPSRPMYPVYPPEMER